MRRVESIYINCSEYIYSNPDRKHIIVPDQTAPRGEVVCFLHQIIYFQLQ